MASDALEAAGLRLTGVRTKMEWSSASSEILLSDLEAGVFGGRASGRLRLGFAAKTYEADLKVEGLDLASLAAGLRGKAGFTLVGRGSMDREFAAGAFAVQGLGFQALARPTLPARWKPGSRPAGPRSD